MIYLLKECGIDNFGDYSCDIQIVSTNPKDLTDYLMSQDYGSYYIEYWNEGKKLRSIPVEFTEAPTKEGLLNNIII